MSWGKVADIVSKFAPLAGGLIGGPAGLKVGAIVASALGVENTPNAIEQAIKTDPDAALKLREMELSNREALSTIALDLTRAELADKANARAAHKHSVMPAVIVCALTVMVACGAYLLFTQAIPSVNKEISYLLFGALLTKWGDSIAYWVGTTRSSANKDANKTGGFVA